MLLMAHFLWSCFHLDTRGTMNITPKPYKKIILECKDILPIQLKLTMKMLLLSQEFIPKATVDLCNKKQGSGAKLLQTTLGTFGTRTLRRQLLLYSKSSGKTSRQTENK